MGQKVDIEFFGEDALENVAACLKFRFDKVIFLGYEKTMTEEVMTEVEDFLTSDFVGVKEVEFKPVTTEYMDGEEVHNIYELMRSQLYKITKNELEDGNQPFFDLTGGEDVALVASGVVSEQLEIPMHQVSLHKGIVRYLARVEAYDSLERRDLCMSVEQFINLQRARIADDMQKTHKEGLGDSEVKRHMKRLFCFYLDNEKLWSKITFGFQQFDGLLDECMTKKAFEEACRDKKNANRRLTLAPTMEEMELAIRGLARGGFLYDVDITDNHIAFSYMDERVRDTLRETGAILEIMTYYYFMEQGVDDAKVGLSLHWNSGIEPDPLNIRVLYNILWGRIALESEENDKLTNEVDLIVMKNNVPTFVSCKNRKVGDNDTLYQLLTVTKRFGGKLANMALVCKDVEPTIRIRCEEMGIQIVTLKDL